MYNNCKCNVSVGGYVIFVEMKFIFIKIIIVQQCVIIIGYV